MDGKWRKYGAGDGRAGRAGMGIGRETPRSGMISIAIACPKI